MDDNNQNTKSKDKSYIWLQSSYTLRKLIGILGISLPMLLYLFLLIDTGHKEPLDSISHYYFTRVSSIFTVIVGTLALFLIVYDSYRRIDFYVSTFAGIAALIVIFYPTSNITDICNDSDFIYSVTVLKSTGLRSTRVIIHYIGAALFLLCLAYMSLFLFTKSHKDDGKKIEKTPQKKKRDKIYITCGIIMIIALAIIFIGGLFKAIPEDIYKKYHLTFWLETIAVISFGISWLTKGEAFLKDK